MRVYIVHGKSHGKDLVGITRASSVLEAHRKFAPTLQDEIAIGGLNKLGEVGLKDFFFSNPGPGILFEVLVLGKVVWVVEEKGD